MSNNHPINSAPGQELRIKQAETRTDQANTRTAEANSRTDQANTRTDEANTRTQQADLRTEKAEVQGEALRASELSYRRLFEAARDGILILDADTGRISDVNPFLIELLGFSHDEMLGKTVGELSPFKDLLSNQAMLERLQNDGFIRYEDLPLETRDGRSISVEFVSNVYRVGDNKVIQCNIRDITERKAAEMGMGRLSAIVESSGDAIFGTDLDGVITNWNKGAETIFGYTAAELVGTSNMRLIPADRQEELNQILEQIKRGEHGGHLETLRQTKDGQLVGVSLMASPIKDDNGKVVGVSKILRDITERKRAAESLHRSEQRYRSLFETARDFIFTISSQGIVTTLNPEFFAATGWTPDECVGQSYERLIQAGDLARAQELFGRALHGVALPVFELRMNRRNGGPMPTEFTTSTRAENGQVVELLGIGRDITERKQSENALLETELRLAQAMSLAQLVAWEYDVASGLFYFSDRYFVLHGTTAELEGGHQMSAGDFVRKFVHPDDAHHVADEIGKAVATADPDYRTQLECRIFRRDGELRHVLVSIAVTKDAAGRTVQLHGANQDITERKRSEVALRESEALLKESQLIAGLGSYALDLSVGLWSSSEVLDQLFGIGPDYDRSVAGWTALIHPDERAMMVDYLEHEVLTQRQPFNKEYRIVRRQDQSERWVNGLGKLEFDAQGRPVKMIGTIQDITARKLIEISLTRFGTAVEQSAETIVIADLDAKILYVNPAFEKSTGYARAEALGQNPRILKSGQQDAAFYRGLWDVLGRGEVWHGHFRNQRKDGTLYEEEATISPVRDAAGKVISYVAVKRDVTKEVQLESQLRQSQKMEAFGQLAGGVAHDFNNILAVIQLQAGLLKSNQGLSLEQLDFAREIEKSAQRGADLTRQLLLFSRKQTMQAKNLELKNLLDNMTKMLRRTLGEQIELQLKLAPEPLVVHADPGMLDQIILNLTVNARDAMPKGGTIIIETSAVELDAATAKPDPQARPGAFVCLSVRDTGSGIPPEIMPRIFEPFFTTKEVGKGTGLGLATVFGIVQQHQGWINVESEVDRGTTFRIYLPRQTKALDTEFFWSPPAALLGGRETILLVEDELSVCLALQIALTRLGYRVLEAANGEEALALWQKHRDEICLLLTDLVMPGGMNGKELAAQFLLAKPELKVIYTSGYSVEVAGQDLWLEEGVNFLIKPFAVHKLAEILRRNFDPADLEPPPKKHPP